MWWVKKRAELVETDIPSVYVEKRKWNWGVILGIVVSITAIVGFGYATWDRFFYTPDHHKITWVAHHPAVDNGKLLETYLQKIQAKK